MTTELMAQADQVMAKTYKRFPVVFVEGSGCFLYDTDGRRYTDFVAGIAVCNLGHSHPGESGKHAMARVKSLLYRTPDRTWQLAGGT
jgi:acetylornithine/succinyldiaminopimelate/putrescine aminotransferase